MTTIFAITPATADEADAYHEPRGNASWTGEVLPKNQALARSWDYITNAIKWRAGVFDSDVAELATTAAKNAQIVGALRELITPGVLQPDLTRKDFVKSKDTGGLKKSYEATAPAGTVFNEIDAIVRPYVQSGCCINLERG